MSRSSILAILVVALLGTTVQTFAQTVPPQQEEPKLIATLKDADASRKDKVDACRQLAIIGGKDSIAPLAALLADEELSHMARYVLEPNPDPAVDAALREALGRLEGRLLVGVIGSVGVRRDPQAVDALVKRLRTSNAQVARAAARALGSIGTPQAAQALREALPDTSGQMKLHVCEGLFRCAERLTADGRKADAIAIYDQMRELDEPHQVRGGALRRAIVARGEGGLDLLRQYLRSDDYILFSAAVQAAQGLSGQGVIRMLAGALDEIPADNQAVVIRTLGLKGDDMAVPALSNAAQDGPTPVRIAAIESLTEIGDPEAVPLLVRLMHDSDRTIAQAAQDNLAAFPSERADDAVLRMFRSDDTDRQLTALELMGRRRMTDSIPVLMKAARQGDARVRPSAIRMVGELGDTGELPAVLDLLAELEGSQELASAEQALVAICTKAKDAQAQAEKLIARLDRSKPAQKAALLRVLGAVGGPDALEAVRSAAGSDNAQVRSAAARALSTWKTGDAAPHLLTLAKDTNDPSEKVLFLRGYINLAGRRDLPVQQRLAMCRQAASMTQRDAEKRLLLGTLSNIESPEAMGLIVPHLSDPATKEEAALAAVTLGERLLKRRNADRLAGRLIEPLEKVAQADVGNRSKQRANALLRQARKTAGQGR